MSTTAGHTTGRPVRVIAIVTLIAVLLLFTVVLPARKGYDPTGIGGLLGMTAREETGEQAAFSAMIEDVIGGNDALEPATGGGFSEPIPLPNPAIHQQQAGGPRTETVTVRLDFDGRTEVKAVLEKGKVILYEWTVEGGQVYVDFHGHDPARGKDFWVRYEEADGVTGGAGSLVAPFAGEHGWFWLNVSEEPVTVHLKVTGYQDRMIEYGPLQ